MEYQKNIATNVYHGFGALIALIISCAMELKIDTDMLEAYWFNKCLVFLVMLIFIYHMVSMKKLK